MTDLKILTNKYFLTFIFRYKSSDFVYRKTLSKSHLKLHNIIWELKQEGLGYRKISKRLNEMGIKSFTGKSFYPSLVNQIYKMIEKKLRMKKYPTISEYYDFEIVFKKKV